MERCAPEGAERPARRRGVSFYIIASSLAGWTPSFSESALPRRAAASPKTPSAMDAEGVFGSA
jgi:hypothetical protein